MPLPLGHHPPRRRLSQTTSRDPDEDANRRPRVPLSRVLVLIDRQSLAQFHVRELDPLSRRHATHQVSTEPISDQWCTLPPLSPSAPRLSRAAHAAGPSSPKPGFTRCRDPRARSKRGHTQTARTRCTLPGVGIQWCAGTSDSRPTGQPCSDAMCSPFFASIGVCPLSRTVPVSYERVNVRHHTSTQVTQARLPPNPRRIDTKFPSSVFRGRSRYPQATTFITVSRCPPCCQQSLRSSHRLRQHASENSLRARNGSRLPNSPMRYRRHGSHYPRVARANV